MKYPCSSDNGPGTGLRTKCLFLRSGNDSLVPCLLLFGCESAAAAAGWWIQCDTSPSLTLYMQCTLSRHILPKLPFESRSGATEACSFPGIFGFWSINLQAEQPGRTRTRAVWISVNYSVSLWLVNTECFLWSLSNSELIIYLHAVG